MAPVIPGKQAPLAQPGAQPGSQPGPHASAARTTAAATIAQGAADQISASPPGTSRVLVTDADDGHDRAAAIGFDDRVDARIESRADQGLDAGQSQFLKLGIRQVDHLGDKVAGEYLVEIFLGELSRNGVMRQVRLGTRSRRTDLERRIQLDARACRECRST